MPVSVQVTDTRMVTCSVPANKADTRELLGAIGKAVADGYELADASTVTGGSQRDPYVTGIRLNFKR